jgi:pyruvate dehydrogenase E2 component (dihydrolipoamide acetyltransferase)
MTAAATATEIRMPRLSDSMTEGTITSWLVQDGDAVAADQEIVEIETDKATMPYATESAGVIRRLVGEGATVAVGEPIATLGPGTRATRSAASPAARHLAREAGIDLATVAGSGPGGRIVRADVEAVLAGAAEVSGGAGAGVAEVAAPAEALRATEVAAPAEAAMVAGVAPPVDAESRELTRAQRLIADRMTQAKTTVPEFTVETEVAMDQAIELREQLKRLGGASPVPSLNDLVVKAAALALRGHPHANASYVDGHVRLHRQINVGIAVAAPDMLLVPTIFAADTKTLGAIAKEARELAERGRQRRLTPRELAGGTFTVSNLGVFGVTALTPIIFVPQAAILGVGAVREVVRLRDGHPVAEPTLTLTLSCDHRVLYGADAALFLGDVRTLLEAPLHLML